MTDYLRVPIPPVGMTPEAAIAIALSGRLTNENAAALVAWAVQEIERIHAISLVKTGEANLKAILQQASEMIIKSTARPEPRKSGSLSL